MIQKRILQGLRGEVLQVVPYQSHPHPLRCLSVSCIGWTLSIEPTTRIFGVKRMNNPGLSFFSLLTLAISNTRWYYPSAICTWKPGSTDTIAYPPPAFLNNSFLGMLFARRRTTLSSAQHGILYTKCSCYSHTLISQTLPGIVQIPGFDT